MISKAVIAGILSSDEEDICALVAVAGGSPSTFLRGANFNGIDLRDTDLRGFNLNEASFVGATINRGTKVDPAFKELLQVAEVDASSLVQINKGQRDRLRREAKRLGGSLSDAAARNLQKVADQLAKEIADYLKRTEKINDKIDEAQLRDAAWPLSNQTTFSSVFSEDFVSEIHHRDHFISKMPTIKSYAHLASAQEFPKWPEMEGKYELQNHLSRMQLSVISSVLSIVQRRQSMKRPYLSDKYLHAIDVTLSQAPAKFFEALAQGLNVTFEEILTASLEAFYSSQSKFA
jgi:HPt (histidine-containing phosphotransfer) domain-containing protein